MRRETHVLSVILIMGLGATTSADLLIHWGLDESRGTTAYDSVGDNHGRLIGNTAWAPAGGKFGGAARFDGADDSVRLTAAAGPFPVSDYPFTLMGWCKTTKSTAKAVVVAVAQGTSYYYWVGVQNGRGCVTARITSRQYEQIGGPGIANDQWHHVCGVYHGPDNRPLYVDGVEVTQDTRSIEFLTGIRRVAAGALDRDPVGENIVDEMNGAVDDVAVFDEALDIGTINRYMVHGIPTMSPTASEPSPADGEADVPRDIALSWVPGESAHAHDVYLGAVLEEVDAAGRSDAADVLVSRAQDANSYTPAAPLEFGKTYYWRVDEVNAAPDFTVFKGALWSFTVEPMLYPVENIVVTASIPAVEGASPQNTVNGSGLDAADQHSNTANQMWLGDNSAGGPVWIAYEFDKVYKLQEMWVWNYNTALEPFVHFGIKDAMIEYSTDGTNWMQFGATHQFAQAPGTAGYAHNTAISFDGAMARYVRITAKSNWGTLSQYGLSEVRFYHKPVQAREPSPANEAAGVSLEGPVLNWRPGREAASHAVYFSTDRQAVIDGTALAGTTAEHSFDPGSLDFGTTCFWRVDEVNEAGSPSSYPGESWSFTTQEYSVVDDFESYTNDSPHRVFQAWIDGYGFSKDEFFPEGHPGNGTGAIVGYDPTLRNIMETAIVHGGGKSMPVEYNNVNSPFYSETERTWDTPQDWTTHGADTLVLYLRGNPVDFLQRPDGSIVMGGGGTDIWAAADQFRFAYKQLNGDGSITARVDSLVQADPWAKVGVMIRETLDAGSKHAAVVVTPGNGVSFVRRPTANAASEQVNQTALQAPYWVRLTRKGNTFTAQRSADGSTWMSITTDLASAADIAMTPDVFIGLAVTSHNTSMQTRADLSSVATTGSVTAGPWQDAEIGVAQPSNDPAPLYVAVEDKTGHKKLVVHSSPEAATTAAWQQWRIPFGEFTSAGVSLTAVKKMSIGAGDRTSPMKGGSGLLFIDDIGVGKPSDL